MLTQARLKETFEYQPDTGEFFRIRAVRGRAAGHTPNVPSKGDGYVRIGIDYRQHLAHRLAWLYVVGELPAAKMEIDHINGVRNDNRWKNLRLVDSAINKQNIRAASKNNKLGILGVQIHQGKYRARIYVSGVTKELGQFDKLQDASNAYMKAKREFHSGCTV